MIRNEVKSSNIKTIGHEGDKLHVEFTNGKVFEYEGVSTEQYGELMSAKSVGSHFAKSIRNNHKCCEVGCE